MKTLFFSAKLLCNLNSLFAILLLGALFSCKKEKNEPKSEVPIPPTSSLTLNTLVMADVVNYNMPLGHHWYTDFTLLVNGDSLTGLSSHTTEKTVEQIFADYSSGTPLPTNGIAHSISLGQNYTIKVIDNPSGQVIAQGIGQFILDSDGQSISFCSPNGSSCGVTWDDSALDVLFPNGFDVVSGEELGGIKSTGKVFYVPGLTVAN